jgi:hypothetical protein
MQGEYTPWGKMQARILSRFQEHWPETHPYVRFRPYPPYVTDVFADILIPGQFERVAGSTEGDDVFLFPDCQDRHTWEVIFAAGTWEEFARTLFLLDRKPSNWQEVIQRLFEIAQLLDGYPAKEFENELSICRCLCTSADMDLTILKVDLPESTVLSILEDTAREEDLELVVHRPSRKVSK